MEPLPKTNRTYALFARDEKQHLISANRTISIEAAALHVNTLVTNSQKSSFRPRFLCEHCNRPGHAKAACFEVIGYPPTWTNKGRVDRKGNRDLGITKPSVHTVQATAQPTA